MKKENVKLCDQNCNECPIILHPNSRMVTAVLNALGKEFDYPKVNGIVNGLCPNLTVCYDCRIDDFTHFRSCKIVGG